MSSPSYKLFPCVFCTLGYNCYVAGHKLVSFSARQFSHMAVINKTQQSNEQTSTAPSLAPISKISPLFDSASSSADGTASTKNVNA